MSNMSTGRTTIIAAIIAGVFAIAVALINRGGKKKADASSTVLENKAETKGDQSPAISGAHDVNIDFGVKENKQKK